MIQAQTILKRGTGMTFCEYLKDKYGENEPIYVEDIQFLNYSRPWIFGELKKLIANGKINRFDTGIYYFPAKMFYGDGALSPFKVIQRRFVRWRQCLRLFVGYFPVKSIRALRTSSEHS